MAVPPLAIHLFGPLRVTVRGAPLPRVRTRSVEWLLALLTLRHGRPVSRTWLAGTLWPESGESRALQNLRDDLMRLRQALGPEGARIQSPARHLLTLDLAGAEVDIVRFDAGIQAGDETSLREAVAVYTGPLLEGCVEEWVLLERETRAEQCLAALETLAERAAERRDHRLAIRYLKQAEALDPLRDSLQQRLMVHLAAAGDPAAAVEVYRDFRNRLHAELAAAPDAETTRLFHEIRARARCQDAARRLAPFRVTDAAAEAVPRASPVPLPHPLTSLIGRDGEVAEIQAVLEEGRLVTLVGAGGVGKTRLALEVATTAGGVSPAGAVWVELAPLADGALVLPTVASALDIREEGGEDAEALTRRIVSRLSDGVSLLVLDNCEHVLDAAAGVSQMLLERCPNLRLLATSRQRLRLPGEVVWRVPSLPAPDPEQLSAGSEAAVAEALGFAAVRLFVERAAAIRPGFRLGSGAEAAAVGQICRRLDGIPLALELAAARVPVLPVAKIAARLDDRFSLLTGGARGALPRHQTLRALIDWSYDGLPEAEAALLRRLSVFAGGWTLEGAEAVCGGAFGAVAGARCPVPGGKTAVRPASSEPGTGHRAPGTDVLDLLDALVDRSLVQVDVVAEGMRYRMLETVREYASEKLDRSGERTAVRNRHRDWYLQLAEQADAAFHRPEQKEWLTRLEAEIDNLRAALAWCQEQADGDADDSAEAGLRLAAALWGLWHSRGYVTEGLQWLEGALARGNTLPASVRAPALQRAAHLAQGRGDRERSRTFLRAAHREYERVLTLARREGSRADVARTLVALAEVSATDEDLDAAWSYCVEARQSLEELDEPVELARTLAEMAVVALRRGDLRTARPLLEERLAICRKLGDPGRLVHALGAMGHLERSAGDYARAQALYRESLLLRRELGDLFAQAQALEDLAVLAGRQGEAERAIRLLGAAEAFCETLGARLSIAIAVEYERTVAEGRATLGEAAFAAAWAEGRAMSVEEATRYALEEPAG